MGGLKVEHIVATEVAVGAEGGASASSTTPAKEPTEVERKTAIEKTLLEKEADFRFQKKEYFKAGELYANDLVKNHAKAGEAFLLAAEKLSKHDWYAKAGEHYKLANKLAEAAAAFAAAYDHRKLVSYGQAAATCYEQAGAFEPAATYWAEIANKVSTKAAALVSIHGAARCYRQVGMMVEATPFYDSIRSLKADFAPEVVEEAEAFFKRVHPHKADQDPNAAQKSKYQAIKQVDPDYQYEWERGAVSLPKRTAYEKSLEEASEFPGTPVIPAEDMQVKYLAPEERETYRVMFEGGRLMSKLEIAPDWGKTKDGQWNERPTARMIESDRLQPLDTAYARSVGKDSEGRMIFVMSPEGEFYAGNHRYGWFHHSSFLAGGGVAAAGELAVHYGTLKLITNKSGHYKPKAPEMLQALQELAERGVSLANVDYSDLIETKQTYNAEQFLNNPLNAPAKPKVGGTNVPQGPPQPLGDTYAPLNQGTPNLYTGANVYTGANLMVPQVVGALSMPPGSGQQGSYANEAPPRGTSNLYVSANNTGLQPVSGPNTPQNGWQDAYANQGANTPSL